MLPSARVLASLAASVVALVVALIALAQGHALAQSSAPTPLRFSFEWRLEGPMAFLLLPQDRNYYRQEGVDLSFDESGNALEAITRVASGSHNLGIADISTLISYRDQNPTAPVKSIFMVYNRPPFSVVARKSRRITDPKLLEGKKLGAAPAGATLGIWPVFAKLNGIDAGKVTIEEVNNLVRIPMLAAGQIDGTLGFTFRDYVDFKDRGVPVDDIVLLHMPDYGLKTYGSAIIVNSKFAAEKPEAIKAFLRALLRGLKETVKNPTAAIDSVVKRDDMERKEIELERLIIAIRDNVVTPEVRANGYGAIDPVRFEEMMSQRALAQTFKARPKVEDIFDGAFLPSAADRKVN
jgi:NitT/TauT family transport system substrate-binding protein